MIGPVSTTGKAMLESLQNAMSKGMPVEQAISYVKSLAMDGVAPLTDLYSMMLQFQRLKQPTRRPPEGGSIREQLESLRNPMEMGLGSMNAGVMENPQGFNAGGIVAFDNGGAAQSAPAGITPQLYGPVPKFTNYDEQAEFYNRLLQDPEFLKKQMAEREALAKEQGFDEFGQSFKLREGLLKEDQRRAETVAAEEAGYDEQEYWGDVAANAAESGATLLTSLAKAQKGKATRKRATAEKARLAIREAKNTEILLEQAREAEREGRYKDAETLRAKAYESAMGARTEAVKAAEEKAKGERSRQTQLDVARVQQETLNPLERKQLEYLNRLETLRKQGKADTPEYTSTLRLYETMKGGGGRSGNISVLRTLLTGAQRKQAAANKILTDPMQRRLATPEAIAQAEADIAEAEAQIQELLAGNPELQAAMASQSGQPSQGGATGFTVLGSRPAQ